MCKCSRCTLLCSQLGAAVDKIAYESEANLFLNLRQATNMNSYIRNHCGLHNVTNCIWSSGRHDNIIRTLSYNHTHTIIQIQAMALHAGK